MLIQFHAVLCLEAQRKGMVITMTKRTKIALSLILVMCMLITGMPSGIANAENEPALQAAPDVMASLAESCKILN